MEITDRRTNRFSLQAVLLPGDPACFQGYVLPQQSSQEKQAEAFWAFFHARAAPTLDRLGVIDALDDLAFVPPFTSPVAWRTRQILWTALSGKFSLALQLVAEVEAMAPTALLASVRQLQGLATENGCEFVAAPQALDFTRHPLWLEFSAVRNHVARIA